MYVKRLEALENIANSFEGVEKSYAIQAGREVRILVKPDSIDDVGAHRMARDIVHKIEEMLEYPGSDQSNGHPRDASGRLREVGCRVKAEARRLKGGMAQRPSVTLGHGPLGWRSGSVTSLLPLRLSPSAVTL